MTTESLEEMFGNQDMEVAFRWGGWTLLILFTGLLIIAVFMVINKKEKALHVDSTAGDEGIDGYSWQ